MCRSPWTTRPSCRWCGAWRSGGARTRRPESSTGLPGARHARGLDRLLDRQARLACFRLCAQAARDGVEEGAHEGGVGMRAMELLLHPVDELDEILLIAARKRHPRHSALHGEERLVYGGSLLRIHHLMHWRPSAAVLSPESEPAAKRKQAAELSR